MSAYVVCDIHITDAATYRAHAPTALATIARFGGHIIAGGSRIELLEGESVPERIVIIEFPDAETARRWYRSDDYQPALKARLASSHGRVYLIDGVEPPLRPLDPAFRAAAQRMAEEESLSN